MRTPSGAAEGLAPLARFPLLSRVCVRLAVTCSLSTLSAALCSLRAFRCVAPFPPKSVEYAMISLHARSSEQIILALTPHPFSHAQNTSSFARPRWPRVEPCRPKLYGVGLQPRRPSPGAGGNEGQARPLPPISLGVKTKAYHPWCLPSPPNPSLAPFWPAPPPGANPSRELPARSPPADSLLPSPLGGWT